MKNKKVVIIILLLIIIIGLSILAVILYNNSKSGSSKKLECQSDYANVTLEYNDNAITSCSSDGNYIMLDTANAYVKEMGIDSYIEEFITRFEKRYGGTCKISE